METIKLYRENVYINEWDSTISSVSKCPDSDNEYIITLKDTAFFPEGGGQSCDVGSIGNYEVIDVQEDDSGNVLHRITLSRHSNKVTEAVESENTYMSAAPPTAGERVHCRLDWIRRFDNMQRHCGEHILSGIFYDMYGGINRGFHMGAEYMTIDISLEEPREKYPDLSEITFDMAVEAEKRANKVIWSDAPVTVMRFDSREEAEKLPLRKALAFDEDISIVCVGSVDNAADCVACCGTHPATAGQVGLVKVYKVEKYKNMFRIYFEAGERALTDYEKKHDMLTELSGRYSSSIEDFPSKIKSQEQKLREVKDELYHLKRAFIDNECRKLDELAPSGNVLVYKLPHLSLDDTFEMGKRYMGKCKNLLMLYSEKNFSYILVSDGNVDCGKLVKEYASFYRGKGGGNKISARAIFTSSEDAELFADLIQKHLR